MTNRSVLQVVGEAAPPDVKLRFEWAQELRHAMEYRKVDVYELGRRLDKLGYKVSRQGIEAWLAAKASPRPHVQRAIGTALDLPARSIFPLENLPREAS